MLASPLGIDACAVFVEQPQAAPGIGDTDYAQGEAQEQTDETASVVWEIRLQSSSFSHIICYIS